MNENVMFGKSQKREGVSMGRGVSKRQHGVNGQN